MRSEVAAVLARGQFPASENITPSEVDTWGELIDAIPMPVSDDEAKALVGVLGPDDLFGLAFSIRRLVESAPSWPIWSVLVGPSPWIDDLRERARNSGYHPPDDGLA